jgi:NAD(P)-dependent dehydrogenase (short-subunit alcohol dehydrogenase family)
MARQAIERAPVIAWRAMSEFEGKVVIVTGAAGGVGSATVRLLHEAGASVVAEDLDPKVRELETERIAPVVGDVADAATADAAVATAVERFGQVDVLVNNAARFLMKGILDTSDAEWDGLLATNVRGVFVHSRAALPQLVQRESSAIVNMTSISGLVGLASQAAYCATKGAIVQLTRQLAVEFAPQGVRVNAVAPGAIETPFLLDALPPDPEPILADIASSHPLGRNSQAGEIAEVVAFLASDRAGFMTGAIVPVDGGYTAQ